ncbi:MAG: sigma-70 family RNA polymerase sigma factor [Verrucomicrobiales bacterium]|nr:sigma-70 family RNA polymerase sigma factor [Verrucomicrobiales bacterium]
MSDITQLLKAIDAGNSQAGEELLPLVYGELRRLAAAKMARETPGQTLQATALVHEAWLRLVGSEDQGVWSGRNHFFAAAAEAMRRILVDRARQKHRIRHGGELERVDLTDVQVATQDKDETVLAMDEALEKLGKEWPEKAEIVKLRYFTGMTHEEISQALNLSETTVRRHWAFARAWLHAELTNFR